MCQPLAQTPEVEGPVPVVDFGADGPVRCERCKAYVNPFFTFVEGGRSFVCNLCGTRTVTPPNYYCETDPGTGGYRRDRSQRPELCRGACEFVAPPEYQVRPPLPPPLVFLIEASYSSVTNGMLHATTSALISILPSLPPHTRVALVAYVGEFELATR